MSAALIVQIKCRCRPQGFDRRVRNPEVPSARHARRPPARPSSHPHQEVPSERRHSHVVPHLHVGSHLLTVIKPYLFILWIMFWWINLRGKFEIARLSLRELTRKNAGQR